MNNELTPKPRTPRLTYPQVEQALKDAGGVQSIAAKMLGVSRVAVHRWVNEYPELRDIIREYEGRVTDMAANNIIKAIKNGNLTASMFWLKTRAKAEGWSDRLEVAPITKTITATYQDWTDIPLEQRIEYAKRLADKSGGEPDGS